MISIETGAGTYPTTGTLAKTAFTGVFQRRGDTVVPNEFVDVEAATTCRTIFVDMFIFHNKHLISVKFSEKRGHKHKTHLTNICNLEHLLVV